MTDLLGNRHQETYSYRKVDWSTWQDGEDLGNVMDGSIELSAFSDLKVSGSFTYKGEAPEQDSIVRIYYSFLDDDGNKARYPLATLIVCYADRTLTADYEMGECAGLVADGTADCCSVLKILQDRLCGMPFTVSANTNPVQKAIELITSLGLRVVSGDLPRYALANDHTFEPSDSYLTVVNWLLAAADYQSVIPDANGRCQITRYVPPESREVVWTFRNDGDSIMYPEVREENDWQSTPNVVKAYYEDDACAIYAESSNVSGSRASLDSRGGRALDRYESVSELEGSTAAEKLEDLKAYAEKVLLDSSNEIERVTVSHPYVPIKQGDAVRVEYADRVWQGTIQNMPIRLAPSTRCDTLVRRFTAPSIQVETVGGIVWEVT